MSKTMTLERYEEIKEKVEALKIKKTKAETTIESIQDRWKKDFGFTSVEEAEKKKEEIKKEIDQCETRLISLSEKIEGLTDWDEV